MDLAAISAELELSALQTKLYSIGWLKSYNNKKK
jgi:hypothetical protein